MPDACGGQMRTFNPWPRVREGCEPPYGCSNSDLGPLVEQPVLFTLWAISPTPVRAFLRGLIEERDHTKCGRWHPMAGWHWVTREKEEASHMLAFFFLLPAQLLCEQAAPHSSCQSHASSSMPSHHNELVSPDTVSRNKSFLPRVAFCQLFGYNGDKSN